MARVRGSGRGSPRRFEVRGSCRMAFLSLRAERGMHPPFQARAPPTSRPPYTRSGMQSPFELTASELAAAIRDRIVTASDVLEAHLERIARVDPALNAIVTLDADAARARAREADRATSQGVVWGPLHGVPFTLKDCHATAGMRTTVGYPPLSEHVPAHDGTVAARMKAAGGILLGKTNVPPLLGGPYTDNPIFGRTNNPWDLARTPGGSSGGAAAAVAARMIPIDIGSDAIGSVRLPAHFCGLFGLKPSERRVSLHGHHCFGDLPGAPRTWRSICTVGPLARSMEDLELAFSLLAGPDGFDTDVPPLPVAPVDTPPLRSLRVAWARTLPSLPVARELSDAVERLSIELQRAGARVEERLPELDWPATLQNTWTTIQLVGGSPDTLKDEPTPARVVQLVQALELRDTTIRAFDAFMAEHDVLLLPAALSTAFVHAALGAPLDVDGAAVPYKAYPHHCATFNMTGQPAVVLPYTLGEGGLPIGVQLVGKRWQDERLLAVARAVSALTGTFRAPPEIVSP
jgi:amidase